MAYIGLFFGKLLRICYEIVPNYGWAIVLFTFFSKIIILPISVMVQFNSIKMVKMYPELNVIKTEFHGNNTQISEERYKLYKREKYNPILDLLPVAIQLIFLMGIVEGVRNIINSEKIMPFLGIDLASVPITKGGIIMVIPLLAAVSALLMCITQNISNVLQSEQGTANKGITLFISVGLSLYLGLFVPAGIGLYWIAGNILSILQMYILNYFINPKKYIDYEALEDSKKGLERLREEKHSAKKSRTKAEISKEKQDYKSFLKYGTKQLVFYSEKNGFYKYFKDIIEYILKKTDITIHYITSDISDEVFSKQSENFRVYYIGENRLTVLMMKMDADVVVMTMPDLQKYHIKRSLVRNDIEYIYIDHGIGSINMMLRKHALDAFDTIFATNENAFNEIKAQEKKYDLKEKTIVKYGFCLIDNMIDEYERNKEKSSNDYKDGKKNILIAPSWQNDNILDSCIFEILNGINNDKYNVIIRPHPQYVRHSPEKIKSLQMKYDNNENIEVQTNFASNETVFNADILITDWSSVAFEYTFTTLKPVLFVNTPMKVMNPDYKDIGVTPIDIEIRNKIGIEVELGEVNNVQEYIDKLLTESQYNIDSLKVLREKYLYNVGHSAEVGAKYIIGRLIEYSKKQ